MENSMEEQIKTIINETINPWLSAHAGSVSMEKVEVVDKVTYLYLNFEGGCSGCPSSFSGTLKMIENYLREECNIPQLLVVNSEADRWA
jgi:Fe-S cluster biogenesis protein NfuA